MEKIYVRKITSTDKDKEAIFKIRTLGEILNGKDLFHPLHRHDFFLILVVDHGEGSHEIDFNAHKITDKSVFVMRPGQAHKLELKAGSIGYLVEFTADFYNKASNHNLSRLIKLNHIKFNATSFDKVISLLRSIYEEQLNKLTGFQDVIRAILDIFFVEVNRHCNCAADKDKLSSLQRLDSLLELLERYSVEQKEVSFYADKLSLSLYQLNAITKTALNKNASQVINEHIILEAKRYLLATSHQINQIAYELGYGDVSYFVRFFKKQTGYSPEVFRQNFS